MHPLDSIIPDNPNTPPTTKKTHRRSVKVYGCELGLHDCISKQAYILHVIRSHILAPTKYDCLLGQSEPKELHLLRTSNSQNTNCEHTQSSFYLNNSLDSQLIQSNSQSSVTHCLRRLCSSSSIAFRPCQKP
jgi:hypothetical protein